MGWDSDKAQMDPFAISENGPVRNTDELSEHIAVHQQRFDAESLKRYMTLQRQIADHVNTLRQAVQDVAQVVSEVNLSAFPLHVGAMPEWYESATKNADSDLSDGLAAMEYIAQRLADDYLA